MLVAEGLASALGSRLVDVVRITCRGLSILIGSIVPDVWDLCDMQSCWGAQWWTYEKTLPALPF